jgi:hypothetical protein
MPADSKPVPVDRRPFQSIAQQLRNLSEKIEHLAGSPEVMGTLHGIQATADGIGVQTTELIGGEHLLYGEVGTVQSIVQGISDTQTADQAALLAAIAAVGHLDQSAVLAAIAQLAHAEAVDTAAVLLAVQQLSNRVDKGFQEILQALVGPVGPGDAVALVVTVNEVQGGHMPLQISVDDVSGVITYFWVDDHGDTDALAPLGSDGTPVVVTFSSDNPAVATVTGNVVAAVAEGFFNVVTDVTNAYDGTPAVWPSGSLAGSPITAPPVACQVVAGPADALVVTVQP